MVGIITVFNPQRRFGFITITSGERYFFHLDNFIKGEQPVLGGRVYFQVGPSIAIGKPDQAVNVRYAGSGEGE